MDVVLLFVPFAGEARRMVAGPPLVVGTCTILTEGMQVERRCEGWSSV
jgi:hypothetical protein